MTTATDRDAALAAKLRHAVAAYMETRGIPLWEDRCNEGLAAEGRLGRLLRELGAVRGDVVVVGEKAYTFDVRTERVVWSAVRLSTWAF